MTCYCVLSQALIDHFKKRLDHHIANPHAVIKSFTAITLSEQAVELVFGGLAQSGLNAVLLMSTARYWPPDFCLPMIQ